jgi:N-ethylmaleimide reductase
MYLLNFMSEVSNPLLASYQLGDLALPNRIIMAPLTRSRAGRGNAPTDLNATYYQQRASAGLIISEGTQISKQGVGYPWTPGIYTPEQIKGWQKVTNAVHKAGGRIFAQLWHVGRVSLPRYHNQEKPVAPSAVKPEGKIFTEDGMKPFGKPRALKTEEIPDIVKDYQKAAKSAMDAGFDGVELHGANGYLIEQFIKNGSNRRTDSYGGGIEKRARFVLEVIEAVTNEIGSHKTGIRFSPCGTSQGICDSNPKRSYSYILEQFNGLNLAYVHLEEPSRDVSSLKNYPSEVAKYFRPVYDGTIITSVNYDRKSGIKAIEENKADLVAYGRLFLANPDLPERFAENASLNEPDRETFYGGGREGYIDYPFMDETCEAG